MRVNTLKAAAAVVVAVAATTFIPHAALAGLTGDSVTAEYNGSSQSSGVNTHTVGAGEEGDFFSNQYYDFGDLSFSIRSTSNYCGIFDCGGQPISLILDDLDFGGALTSVVLSTSLTGVSVVFDSNTVTFTWGEQSLPADTYLSARFVIDGTPVPEPASMALLAAGVLGLGLMRRRSAV